MKKIKTFTCLLLANPSSTFDVKMLDCLLIPVPVLFQNLRGEGAPVLPSPSSTGPAISNLLYKAVHGLRMHDG